ncbi:unnamed protein product, partial [Rotaria socialis]
EHCIFSCLRKKAASKTQFILDFWTSGSSKARMTEGLLDVLNLVTG